MRAKLALWVLALGVLALLAGCDGGGDNNVDELTMANLQGTYDLDITASMPGGIVDDDVNLVSGTLDVDNATVTLALTTTQTRTFAIADGTTVTVTDGAGDTVDVQTTLTDGGATLTLSNGETLVFMKRSASTGTDLTLANLQGTYDMDIANSAPLDIGDEDFVVTSAVLDIMDMDITFTATGTNVVTYAITGASQVTITEADGDVMVLSATLTNDTMRLRVVEDDGDVLVFNKR